MVPEPVDEVLAGEDGGEELAIGGPYGIEPGVLSAVVDGGLAQAVELVDRVTFELHVRQGLEVARGARCPRAERVAGVREI